MLVCLSNAPAININKTDEASNHFQNLHNGIIAQNTNLSVSNAYFENILQATGAPGLAVIPFFTPGKAVFAYGGSLTVIGAGILSGNPATFINCHTAIQGADASLTVSQNKIRQVNTGILSHVTPSRMVSVTANDIEGKDLGIGVYHVSTLPNGCLVSNNIIHMSGNADGIGINTGFIGFFTQNGGNFANNQVTISDGAAGINIGLSQNLNVRENIIDVNNAATKFGIGVSGGDKNVVNCNTISGIGEKGIYGLMTGRSTFNCNSAVNTGLGLHFEGVSVGKGDLVVGGNYLNANAQGGLLLGADAVIGAQVHRGNIWVNSGGVTVARHLGGATLALKSKFTVDVAENTMFLPNFVNPQVWFDNAFDLSPSFACYQNICPPTSPIPNSMVDIKIAKGELTGLLHQAPQLWLAQRRLYEKLTEEGNPYPGDSDINTFLSQSQTNGLKGYADLQTGLRQLFHLSAVDVSDLSAYEGQITQNMSLLAQKEAQLFVFGINQGDSINLDNQRTAILQNLASITALQQNKLAGIVNTRQASATSLSAQNSLLSGLAGYLQNEKIVSGILLQTLASGLNYFSASQLLSLQSIASQCPLSGGESVFVARDMLALVQKSTSFYNDDVLCMIPPDRFEGKLNDLNGHFKIFPNPASDEINIQYNLEETDSHLQIFNGYGQWLIEVILPGKTGFLTIPVTNFGTGIYLYHVDDLIFGKIIINH